jgi:hypothetical protein
MCRRYGCRMRKPLTTADLQKFIARWDDGGGVTAAVQAFAQAVPVAERTVWYWIGGRKIHPAMTERIRSLKPPHNPTFSPAINQLVMK